MTRAEELIESRNSVYGDFSRRSNRYVCSGVDLKAERILDVTKRIREGKEVTKDDIDTIHDLQAYLIELARRVDVEDDFGEPGKTPSGLVFMGSGK